MRNVYIYLIDIFNEPIKYYKDIYKTKKISLGGFMSFLSVWERIKSETDLDKLNQLVDIVGTTQPYISRKKKEDKFPVDWAYKVAIKYGLLTEWILSGKGPRRLAEVHPESRYAFPILDDVNEWLSEVVVNEPYRREWFRASLEDAFPMFKEWKKRKRAGTVTNSTIPTNNID